MHLFLALLRAAHRHFNLINCVGARFGSGLEFLPHVQRIGGTILFFWSRKDPEHVCQFYGANNGSINLRKLIDIPTKELVILQFLMASEEDTDIIRTDVPDVPMLCAPSPLRSPEPIAPSPPSPPFQIQPFAHLGPRMMLDRESGSEEGKSPMSTGGPSESSGGSS